MPKANRLAIEGMQFVHCAIPDMALSEADARYKLKEGFTLPCPIAILADSDAQAKELSEKHTGIPAVSLNSVFINGKLAGKLTSTYLVNVRDGIEAAKAARIDTNALPCISKEESKNIDIYIKQLRIAMFLTNSKNMKALEAAPIYNM